jgi:glutamine synthetase
MIHPGYCLLSDAWIDMSEQPLQIVADTAAGLGLTLTSLEIELGPSQVEAVFDVTDALAAADNMVRFRNGVRQALRRAGYHATFMCRPPFPNVMASGWHLHHSLYDIQSQQNLFTPDESMANGNNGAEPVGAEPAAGEPATTADQVLSKTGAAWLGGLLRHAPAITVFGAPTANAYGRFQPNALAPQSIVWGQDNRGAMLRVIGGVGNPAARIENRVGEPAANPYLYLAAQVFAGLAGVDGELNPPPATTAPYDDAATRLPASLGAALDALHADPVIEQAFGDEFVSYFSRIKRAEFDRRNQSSDAVEFDRREYFSRI